MSSYHGKLLELLNIENKSDHYFLHISLCFEKDIEILWQLDEYTAKNLKLIINFDEKYRYRLSLNSYWDIIQKQYVSTLTKTYRNQSERIYFACSKDYINALTSIKQSQNIRDLNRQDFSLITPEPGPQYRQTVNNFKSTWVSIAVMSVIFTILLGYLNLICLNEMGFNKKMFAQSAPLLNMSSNEQIKEPNPIDHKSPNFIELDQDITYSISKGKVALTFSDGPSKYSIEIMNLLNKYEVGGTFFFIGTNVKKFQNYVKDIHANGYSIGSHSMNHPNLSNY